jgi:hypothetical protein
MEGGKWGKPKISGMSLQGAKPGGSSALVNRKNVDRGFFEANGGRINRPMKRVEDGTF